MLGRALIVLLAGCAGTSAVDAADDPQPGDTDTVPGSDPTADSDTGPIVDLTPLAAAAVAAVQDGHVATSEVCASCHATSPSATALKDAAGRPVGPWDLWRASPMGNAGRDPIWRAAVAAEIASSPSAARRIGETCVRCHAPAAAAAAERSGDVLGLAALDDGTDTMHLARDGVTCVSCHRVDPSNLGTPESFSGGWVLDAGTAVYGPYADPFVRPMEMQTAFTPTFGAHIQDGALCATCHTLDVATLDADGAPTGGHVREQATWLEHQASDHAEDGCVSCHLPELDEDGDPIATRIARQPGGGDFPPLAPREPFGRHVMVGANTLLPALLRDHAATLNPSADRAALDAVIAATRAQIASAASLATSAGSRDTGRVRLDVHVTSHTGHKLPSGLPLRRMWLHVTARDAAGATLVELGAWDARGRILDAAGAPLAPESVGGPLHPHVDRITEPQDVAVWESVLMDADGDPTFRFERGAGYAKDNRLLPSGWDVERAATDELTPVGVDGDDDFVAGGDTVALDLPAAGSGPVEVEVELVLQPVSARWLAELIAVDTPETRALDAMLRGAPLGPERVAVTRVRLD